MMNIKCAKKHFNEELRKRNAVEDLYHELERITDVPKNKSLSLSEHALNAMLSRTYSQEYTLQKYVNKQTWFDSKQLKSIISKWYDTTNIIRIRSKHPVESTLAFLRKYGRKLISRPQIRYLLLKEAGIDEGIKEYFYTIQQP